MHKYIYRLNSITLCLMLTQQYWVVAMITLLYVAIDFIFSPRFWNSLGYLICLAVSLGYVSWLSDINQTIQPGNYHTQGVVTQIQAQQPYYRRFTLLEGLQPWSISWYGKGPPVKLGDCWEFDVKVKEQHSLQNPYRLFQHAVPLAPKYKATAVKGKECENQSLVRYLSHWRTLIDSAIGNADLSVNAKRVVRSLGIGRQDQLSNQERLALQRTGTAHLFAISGLHLTTLALLIYSLATGIGWCFPRLYRYIPKPKFNALVACGFAVIYSLLVGFSLPIQRALFMLLGYTVARVMDWQISAWQLLHLCIFVFLIIQPASVLLPSFWLSFLSVATLIYAFNRRVKAAKGIKQWWRALWVAWLGTIGLNILFFQQISLVALVANAIAIPLVTLFIVPLILAGISVIFIMPSCATLLWWLAGVIMNWLWVGLIKLAEWPWSAISLSHYYSIITVMIIASALFYLLPRYLIYSIWGWGFLLIGLFNRPPIIPEGEFDLHVLDVGQGLSSIIQTRYHTLLYDTGPRYVNYDLGSAVVVPYSHWLNIRSLDTIVVSHPDIDHSGGLLSVLAAMPSDRILSSDKRLDTVDFEYCVRGMKWQWDDVNFEILYPTEQQWHLGNNSSCVLQVSTGDKRVLLTGDIEKRAEKILLQTPEKLPSDVIVVPHHGSKTSSTPQFVGAISPTWALFPVGWHNRFKLPKPEILLRYRSMGAELLRTDEDGAIRMHVSQSQISIIE